MKEKLFTLFACLAFISAVFGQVPEAITYQAAVRDAAGNLLNNHEARFRLSVIQGSPEGMAVYMESHLQTTNQFGMATLKVGLGTVHLGDFSAIDWGINSYFLKTEIDVTGGTDYQLMGTTQFLSVPYALYAKKAGNALPAGSSGLTLRNNGTAWISDGTLYNDGTMIGIGTTQPDSSAILEITSAQKGVLLPRMTQDQIAAIPSPANGLMVFNIDDGKYYVFRIINLKWNEIALGANTFSPANWFCGSGFIDSRDGNIYQTVLIGSQCWMAQNLNIGIRVDGVVDQTNNLMIEKYCYDDTEDSCDVQGGFYQWDEMMNYSAVPGSAGICPEGWHLPTLVDWEILSDELGGDPVSGGYLKSVTGWYFGGNGTNLSGFNAIPTGYRNIDASFINSSQYALHWSSTEQSTLVAWNRYLSYQDQVFHLNSSWKEYGLSVRCIKD